jgi:hypothetical protein
VREALPHRAQPPCESASPPANAKANKAKLTPALKHARQVRK